jgi:hypothetical protein
LASCASMSTGTPSPEIHIPKRDQIAGNGSISIVSPHDNIAAAAVLAVQSPDRVRLEIQDPVGNTLGLLIIHGERFFWQREGRAWIGRLSHPKVAQILPFAFRRGEDLVAALLAQPLNNTVKDWDRQKGEPLSAEFAGLHGRAVQIEWEDYQFKKTAEVPRLVRMIFSADERVVWRWADWESQLPRGSEKIFDLSPALAEGEPLTHLE